MVQQISVFLENKKGRMARFAQVLAGAGVNLISLTVADTAQFGILRCLVDNPEVAAKALQDEGFTVSTNQVLACGVPDKPGGLYDVMEALSQAQVGVEYLYSHVRRRGQDAVLVFQTDDPEKAATAMQAQGFVMLSQSDILE